MENREKLVLLWTSGDREVAEKMVLLYGGVMMGRGYWQEAVLMVWGPSARLLGENPDLQEKVKAMIATGVEAMGCVVCMDDYGVTEVLEATGVAPVHTGEYLTRYLKEGRSVLTI